MSHVSNHRQRGFTLVEVLIALFIFSLISVGATSALTSSLRGQTQMQNQLEDISGLENMRALIRGDMASVILRTRREPYGNVELYTMQSGGETLLDFTRTGRSNPMGEPRGDLQRVAYLFTDGQLIRRSFAQINPAPQSGHIDRVLMSDVAQAKLQLVKFNPALARESYLEGYQLQIENSDTVEGAIKLFLKLENEQVLTQYFELGL